MRTTFHEEAEDDSAPTLGHRRRKLDPGELDITPMIDVTFLLLIFFMVTSTMKEPATADVPPAEHGVGTDTGEALVVTIVRSGGAGEVQIQLPDGSTQSLEQLRDSQALTNQIEAAMNEQPPRSKVILNADRDLRHGIVRQISQMVGEVEDARLFLGVQDR